MFADPVSNLMLIILLFFAGLLVMFVFILRSLELAAQSQEETRHQLAISLTDLERKVAELTFAMRDKGLFEMDELSEAPQEKAPKSADKGQDIDDLASFFERLPQPEKPDANGGERD